MRVSPIRYFQLASVVLLCAVLLAGCNGEQEGGPGADADSDNTSSDGNGANSENTFTASVSDDAFDLSQGQRQELTLSIDRGDAFDQSVTVNFDAPQGITLMPESATIASNESETNVMVEVASTASTAEQALKVTFEPETGKSIEKVVTISVVEPQQ